MMENILKKEFDNLISIKADSFLITDKFKVDKANIIWKQYIKHKNLDETECIKNNVLN